MNNRLTHSNSSCAVIIVTHNSKDYLQECLSCLSQQSCLPAQVILIDSGSDVNSTPQLDLYKNLDFSHYFSAENIGFCRGNNLGFSLVKDEINYVLFINPDAFLSENFLEEAINFLDKDSEKNVAAISGVLMGYNMKKKCPTNTIDSTGIFRKWYGKWYDRHQGRPFNSIDKYPSEGESIPALCGALMFCRKKALEDVRINSKEIWDNSFFMYKEDIDLSLRLKKKNWELKFLPYLTAYHCRGWHKNRKDIPYHFRLLSAKNEMKIYTRHPSFCFIYSLVKYLSVKFLNL